MTQKTAQVILTGYNKPNVKKSRDIILKYSKTINLSIVEDDTDVKSESELWGCEKNNTEQETIVLRGDMDDLQKILHARTEDGIYLQLLLR